ncbi:MAG TPA: site-2 protease family protein [Candidatus Kapabacteria bacterium]|nr:site-2 protease family protein [Candidatus Kapabacteria bacterium]
MRWTFHIARIAGIDVKVHATFLLLLGFYGFAFYGQGGLSAAVQGVIFITLVFCCVLLHEFGHALAARRYGINTPDITLLPIGGLARLDRMPEKPMEELVVAVAGPLVNVVIAGLLAPFVSFRTMAQPDVLEHFSFGLIPQLFIANCILVAFNMIPAFPMDGGRILRAFLAMRMDYAKATNIAASIGQTLAFTGALFALVWWKPMLMLVAIFVFFGAQSEAAHAQMRSITNGLRVRDAMVTRFETLPRTATLQDAVQAVLNTSQHDFPVVDEAGTVIGILTRDDLIVALKETGPQAPVINSMRPNIPSLHPMMYFDRAQGVMQECEASVLPVVDQFGRLVGLFTHENVGELIMLQSALNAGSKQRPVTPPPLPSRG